MKALTVKMEKVTLIGIGRYALTCFVYSVHEINSKICFLIRYFILVGRLKIRMNMVILRAITVTRFTKQSRFGIT
jgi:hypothetical protein